MSSRNDEPEWMIEMGKRMDAAETWEESQAIMHNDPNWIAMMAEKEAKRRAGQAARTEAERPIIEDLRAAGIDVDSVLELNGEHEDAVPVLLEHFGRDYPDLVREEIARNVGVRSMRKELWPLLTDLYRVETPESRAKSGLASSLAYLVTKDTLDEMIELIDDPTNGSSRVMLLWGLKRMRQPQVIDALKRSVEDPQLEKHARQYLKQKERARDRRRKAAG